MTKDDHPTGSRPPPPRSGLSSTQLFLLISATIIAGVILRTVPLGLPFPVTKWGGSWLWGMMIWCAVAILSNGRHPLRTACTAIVLASLTECLKIFHTPALDHFRSGRLGTFLLGHHFAVADLIVYALAITGTALLASRHNQMPRDGKGH